MSLDFSLLSQRSEAIESQWTYRFVTLFQVVVRVTHGGRFEGLLCWGTQEDLYLSQSRSIFCHVFEIFFLIATRAKIFGKT